MDGQIPRKALALRGLLDKWKAIADNSVSMDARQQALILAEALQEGVDAVEGRLDPPAPGVKVLAEMWWQAFLAAMASPYAAVGSGMNEQVSLRAEEIADAAVGIFEKKRDALAVGPGPRLRSVAEHDAMHRRMWEPVKETGVACPKCGAELSYTNLGELLTVYPPLRAVSCRCGYTGSIVA